MIVLELRYVSALSSSAAFNSASEGLSVTLELPPPTPAAAAFSFNLPNTPWAFTVVAKNTIATIITVLLIRFIRFKNFAQNYRDKKAQPVPIS